MNNVSVWGEADASWIGKTISLNGESKWRRLNVITAVNGYTATIRRERWREWLWRILPRWRQAK